MSGLERYRGALVGALVGDALGAAFEGHAGPVPTELLDAHLASDAAAAFTDDTAMTIGLAESLIEVGGLDEDHLAATFARHHEREPGRGYGAGTSQLLTAISRGGDWRTLAPAQFDGAGSFGNGAAMRSTPIGIWHREPQDAALLTARAATVTHTHPHAVDGAAVHAAAVAFALHHWTTNEGADQLVAAVRNVPRSGAMVERLDRATQLRHEAAARVAGELGTSVAALDAVPAAMCAFLHRPTSFSEVIRYAISLGGDTDTIASMAGAVSGAVVGVSGIPESWRERAEGVDAVIELADTLVRRRPEPGRPPATT